MTNEKTNGLITREQLTAAAPRRYKEFLVPNFGTVRIRNLTDGERSIYEADTMGSRGQYIRERLIQARRRLIAITVVDSNGDLLLTEPVDVKSLEEQDGSITDAIFEQAAAFSGMTQADVDQLASTDLSNQ